MAKDKNSLLGCEEDAAAIHLFILAQQRDCDEGAGHPVSLYALTGRRGLWPKTNMSKGGCVDLKMRTKGKGEKS